MLFNLYKVRNDYVELNINIAKEENYNILVELMKLFDLDFNASNCTCLYDKDIIKLTDAKNEIIVEKLEVKQKFFRTIYLKELRVPIKSNETLKKLLQISNDYDAMLSIASTDETNSTIIIVNDNGQDYIRFDKNRFESKLIRDRIRQIFD